MSEKKTGGPAFPFPAMHGVGSPQGLTIRDYFAARALQALLASDEVADSCASGDFSVVVNRYAELSYTYADAMLKAREEGTGKCTDPGCCYSGKQKASSCSCKEAA